MASDLHRARKVESTWIEDRVYKEWSVDHTFSSIPYSLRGHCELPLQEKTQMAAIPSISQTKYFQ